MIAAKKINQTVQDKKHVPYKNDCCQKNRSKTVDKKIAPYKNDRGEKKFNQTVQDKKLCLIKMIVAQKIGAEQLKKMRLINMTAANKNLSQTA